MRSKIAVSKAFTLIELLVVIAILAVLAAVLFPVFSQAKRAAQKTASLSNLRQISTAVLMYAADYDDGVVILLNGPYDNVRGIAEPRADSWVWLLQPYIKDLRVFVDPTRGDRYSYFSGGANSTYGNQNVYPMYGLNYLFLSPIKKDGVMCGSDTGGPGLESRTMSQASDFASTILFTESRRFTQDAFGGYYGVNAPGMWPVIAPSTNYCVFWDLHPCSGNWCARPSKSTSSVSIFHNTGSNVAWLDGHVKFLPDASLAQGTDYPVSTADNGSPTEGAQITDVSKYLWNLNDEFVGSGN